MDSVTQLGRAKINLSLEICRRREDGYHEICSVMQSLCLYDTVHLRPRAAGFSVTVVEAIRSGVSFYSGRGPSGLYFVPRDNRNIAWRAAETLLSRAGIRSGVEITIEKAIPVAAGLAGGSADAAAVLRGLNELFELGYDLPELAEIGREIGSDVPFCVQEGTALVEGIGEKVRPVKGMPLFVVLAKPEVGVSTALAYREFDKIGVCRCGRSAEVVAALEAKSLPALCGAMVNHLAEATYRLRPELNQLEESMRRAGCLGVLMTGSGPTMFGLADSMENALEIGRRLQNAAGEIIVTEAYLKGMKEGERWDVL